MFEEHALALELADLFIVVDTEVQGRRLVGSGNRAIIDRGRRSSSSRLAHSSFVLRPSVSS